jgi:hypothetical protein
MSAVVAVKKMGARGLAFRGRAARAAGSGRTAAATYAIAAA